MADEDAQTRPNLPSCSRKGSYPSARHPRGSERRRLRDRGSKSSASCLCLLPSDSCLLPGIRAKSRDDLCLRVIITAMGNFHSDAGMDRVTVNANRPEPYLRLQSVNVFVRDLD